MATLKLNQPILDFEGNPVRKNIQPEAVQMANMCITLVNDLFGEEKGKKFANELAKDKYLKRPTTYKDVVMSVLMSEDDASMKIDNFKLLQSIANSDSADLGLTERERINKKVNQTEKNVLIVGRVQEYLVDAFADEKEEPEKPKKKKSKKKKAV